MFETLLHKSLSKSPSQFIEKDTQIKVNSFGDMSKNYSAADFRNKKIATKISYSNVT